MMISLVIASGTKQSRAVYAALDCFAPLAMTGSEGMA